MNNKLSSMLITISLLILAYLIMGKDIKSLLERVKNIDWQGKINALMDAKVEDTLNEWFGVEYELVEG